MGTTVYGCENPDTEGAHIYCHSRKDGKEGIAYLIINNSLTKTTAVEIPKAAECYILSAEHPRASVMMLNGRDLTISGTADLPDLSPVTVQAGTVEMPPCSCMFLAI